jgi:hypothetical protein
MDPHMECPAPPQSVLLLLPVSFFYTPHSLVQCKEQQSQAVFLYFIVLHRKVALLSREER